MEEKVNLSEDGASIDFVQSDSLPTSIKKFRESPEIEGFYRFVYENDLQAEAFDILDKIIERRKALRVTTKAASAKGAKAAKAAATAAAPPPVAAAKASGKAAAKSAPAAKST